MALYGKSYFYLTFLIALTKSNNFKKILSYVLSHWWTYTAFWSNFIIVQLHRKQTQIKTTGILVLRLWLHKLRFNLQ